MSNYAKYTHTVTHVCICTDSHMLISFLVCLQSIVEDDVTQRFDAAGGYICVVLNSSRVVSMLFMC